MTDSNSKTNLIQLLVLSCWVLWLLKLTYLIYFKSPSFFYQAFGSFMLVTGVDIIKNYMAGNPITYYGELIKGRNDFRRRSVMITGVLFVFLPLVVVWDF
jgi:hypothetical protein